MSNTYVTQPSLPPLDEFVASLEKIWSSKRLTNNGPFHQEFEAALAEYLGVPHVSLFCNGMMALQVGLQSLKITGEVITSPYTFPATTHAIYWNHCTPVFCDIDHDTCNIDPEKIESLITPKTTCIMPVHVYGMPCSINKIQHIADTYGLKVLYDAAHAFGAELNGASLCSFGDLSMLSFHATKVFNTIEGGALVIHDEKLKKRIDYLKNFGFANETTVVAPGSNGKMNEVQSAFGLLQLKYVDAAIEKRVQLAQIYREGLADIPGIRMLDPIDGGTLNGAYCPIFVQEGVYGKSRDQLYQTLKDESIHGRRYFYPLISQLPAYRGLPSSPPDRLPHAVAAADQVICLPLYANLEPEMVERIADIVRNAAASG
ncbi:MAG: DegT/DnrJ/EryC1/StrS family aminotransferase [Candidatus Thiodiazotropha sp. (ex Lucinoma kastoroae)]|nr:DegT/DnrJ/EryC1/StrS family aminotransferase [Candidatus Thiodiazotropha sp. (ex Lucinoma kastoroae)]MCU7858680.1 DegT/DnrJ/EryC1/StrS family aminotransferase [Candidatus Thiodiazotropha sp. (ex Lucinoma kastoroae)]